MAGLPRRRPSRRTPSTSFRRTGASPSCSHRGKGALVWDVNGKEYVDCVAGIAVNNVGHCHPKVVAAIQEQAAKLIHTSNLYYTDMQPELAEKLSQLSRNGPRVLRQLGHRVHRGGHEARPEEDG